MDIKQHLSNPALEEHGKWFEYDGAEFLIAANQNPTHKKALVKLGKTKYQAALRKNDPIGIGKLSIESVADGILLDWKGVTNGTGSDGKPVPYPYTRDNVIALLTASRTFYDWVAAQAMELGNFMLEKEEADTAELKSGGSVESTVGG